MLFIETDMGPKLSQFLLFLKPSSIRLQQHLVGFLSVLLGHNTLVWVDKIGRSFFIVISVQDGKNMVIWALHQSLNRLKEQAARVVGLHLFDREQVPVLGLPKVLEEDVKDFIPTHGD